MNNLLKYHTVPKWNVNSALKLLTNILSGCAAGEEDGRLASFLATSRDVEDSLTWSSKSDLNMVFGDKFIKGRNSQSESKSVILSNGLKIKFNLDGKTCSIEISCDTEKQKKKLKAAYEILRESNEDVSMKFTDFELSFKSNKAKRHKAMMKIVCSSKKLNLVEPVIIYLTAHKEDLDIFKQSIYVCYLLLGLCTYEQFLGGMTQNQRTGDDDSDSVSSEVWSIASLDTDMEEEEDEDVGSAKMKYYRIVAGENMMNKLAPEEILQMISRNTYLSDENYAFYKSRLQSFMDGTGQTVDHLNYAAQWYMENYPQWFEKLNSFDEDQEDDGEREEEPEDEEDLSGQGSGFKADEDDDDFFGS